MDGADILEAAGNAACSLVDDMVVPTSKPSPATVL